MHYIGMKEGKRESGKEENNEFISVYTSFSFTQYNYLASPQVYAKFEYHKLHRS